MGDVSGRCRRLALAGLADSPAPGFSDEGFLIFAALTLAYETPGIVVLSLARKALRSGLCHRLHKGDGKSQVGIIDLPGEGSDGSHLPRQPFGITVEIGRASCRERVCQYV